MSEAHTLTPGLQGQAETTVTEANTAIAMGSGTLPVFATPALAALAEQACWQTVAPYLEEGCGTVGTRLNLTHNAPTPLGMPVVCHCSLTAVEGRKLLFTFSVEDARGAVAEGSHERFIIREDSFLRKAQAKAQG